MRLRNINDISTANKFLEDEFIPWFNNKFSVVSVKKNDLHFIVNKKAQEQLDSIFSIHSQRYVNNDFTIQFKTQWFQLDQLQPTCVLKKDRVFIIMENQYRIGDVVCFDGTCGLVEDISMRMTTLRDLDGIVHHVPHGEIKRVSNLSKQFARVNLNIGVSYSSNLEQIISVVNQVGKELAEDPEWKEYILKPPQFLRVLPKITSTDFV